MIARTSELDEAARLEALSRYRILDTPQERDFDDLVQLAAWICQTPISLVSLVDRDRQWFKGRFGLDIAETPRSVSFCSHTIQQAPEVMEVEDATQDPRFAENELVRSDPNIRFYAGAPLVTPEGYALGTLCVIDRQPRHLSAEQKNALAILGRQVMTQLELRRNVAELRLASRQLAETHAQQQALQEKVVQERTAELEFANTELERRKTELQNQKLRLEVLNDASQLILAGADGGQLEDRVFRKIVEYSRASGFVEFSVLPGGQELQLELAIGPKEETLPLGTRFRIDEGVLGRVALTREPLVIDHIQNSDDPQLAYLKHCGVHAFASYPLVVLDRLLGTFAFTSREKDWFEPEDLKFFQTLASSVAVAKDRLLLNRELESHAANLEATVAERTSKLQDMMAELRQMSYSMVHEMRAPLRAIMCFTHLLMVETGKQLTDEARDYLDRIQKSSARMDLLVTEALNYNKVLRDRPPIEPVDVQDLLQELIGSSEEFQEPHAIVRVDGEFRPMMANKGLLLQCFFHLLRNAVKYVEPGRLPEVHITCRVAGDKVQLCFADNGVGIPAELQARIFDLFERGHRFDKESAGVGLPMVRKMAEKMQGRVWVESEPNRGSRFWLELNGCRDVDDEGL